MSPEGKQTAKKRILFIPEGRDLEIWRGREMGVDKMVKRKVSSSARRRGEEPQIWPHDAFRSASGAGKKNR